MSLNNTTNQQQQIILTTTTTLIIPSQLIINIAYILSIIELIVHPFILIISLLNLLILIKNSILHPNLRVILIGQSLSIILFEMQRILLVSQKFISGNIFNPGLIILQVNLGYISNSVRNFQIDGPVPGFLLKFELGLVFRVKAQKTQKKPGFIKIPGFRATGS